MKNARSLALAVCAAALLASGSAFADGDAEAGRVKALPCMGCHGIEGYFNVYPSYHVPKLAGQHSDYVVAALMAYKTGQRSHKTMIAQAASLSEQDMKDIAAFFSTASARSK